MRRDWQPRTIPERNWEQRTMSRKPSQSITNAGGSKYERRVYVYAHFDAPFQVATRKMEVCGWAWMQGQT